MVDAAELLEEEHAHRRQHASLVRDRGVEDVVVGRDSVARDEQQMRVVDRVQIADLAAGQMLVATQ